MQSVFSEEEKAMLLRQREGYRLVAQAQLDYDRQQRAWEDPLACQERGMDLFFSAVELSRLAGRSWPERRLDVNDPDEIEALIGGHQRFIEACQKLAADARGRSATAGA